MKKNKIINFTLVFLMVLSLTPMSLFANEVQNNFVDSNDILVEDNVKEEQQDNLTDEKQDDTTNKVDEENENSKDDGDTNTNNTRDGTQFKNGYQFDYGTVEILNQTRFTNHEQGSHFDVYWDRTFPVNVGGYSFYLGKIALKDGRLAFCIEPSQLTNGNDVDGTAVVWNSFSEPTRQNVSRIVQLGMAKINQGDPSDGWYWATQFAIYRVLGYSITHPNTGNAEHNNRFNTIMGLSDTLLNELNTYGTLPSFENSTQWMGYNHTNRRWEAHLIDTNGVIGTKFSQLNGWRNGNFSTEIKNNVLYVYKDQAHPYDVDPHGYDLNNNSTGGRMEWEPAPNVGGPVLMGSLTSQDIVSSLHDPINFNFSVLPRSGKITLKKTDQFNNPVKDAEFTIFYDANNNKVVDDGDTPYGLVISDENGNVESKLLPDGNYVIKETKTPQHYETSDWEKAFSISGEQREQVIDLGKVVNNKLGEIHLSKTDNYDLPVEKAEFTIYKDVNQNGKYDKDEDTKYKTIKTNSDGKASLIDIPFGDYVIVETKNPWYFYEPDFEEAFKITVDKNVVNINNGKGIVNTLVEGSIELTKHDDYGNPLAGAEFTIYPAIVDVETGELIYDEENKVQFDTNKVAYTLTTDKDGKAQVDKLAKGFYKIVETKAPDGYSNSNYEEVFEVKDDSVIKINNGQPIVNTKIEGWVEVNKVDDKYQPLAGAEFTIYADSKNKEQITPAITREDVDKLEQENQKNNEVELKPTPKTTTSSEDETTPSKDEIIVEEKVEMIGDGEFNPNEDKAVEVLTVDNNGYAKSSMLPAGVYYLKETKTPNGYIGSTEVIKFEITEETALKNNKLVGSYQVINEKIINVKTGTNTTNIFILTSVIALAGATLLFVRRKR